MVQADSVAVLTMLAREGIAAALVDPRMRGLGPDPLARLRAEPALHSCPILLLRDAELAALRAGRPAPALISLVLRIHAQVTGDAQLDLLQDVSGLLTAAPDLTSTMDNILAAVAGRVLTDTATLFVIDEAEGAEGEGALVARAAWGYELDLAKLRRVDVGEGVVGWVVAQRSPTIVGDSDLDERFSGAEQRSKRSMLAVPIRVGHRTLGAITLVRRAPAEQFTDADLVLVGTISNSAGIALESARVYEQEQAVRMRLAQVEEMRREEKVFLDRLEAYDRLYTQVVATVSHELKTPLMGIRGFAQMIRDGGVEAAEVGDFAGEIHDNAVRLSHYVERILDEDAVHSGRVNLDMRPVALAPLVAQVLRSVAPLATPAHRVVNEIPPDLPPVLGDPDKLLQVVTNLVSNAIKYSPEGGRVVVDAVASDETVDLGVEDEGLGIPEESRSRIFDRFYRVPGAAARIAGTGLGLSIVRGLVELHGGVIAVGPGTHDRGSRFVVTLPRSPSIAVVPDPHRAPSLGAAVRPTIAATPMSAPLEDVAIAHVFTAGDPESAPAPVPERLCGATRSRRGLARLGESTIAAEAAGAGNDNNNVAEVS